MGSANDILSLLEKGEIDAAEAERRLGAEGIGRNQAPGRRRNEHRWWKGFSILLAVLGTGIALGIAGGAWWICAAPLLLIGAPGSLIMVAAPGAPWVRVRVDLAERGWPRSLRFSVPLPLRGAAWMLRKLRPSASWRELADLDAMLTGLDEALQSGQPITVEVRQPWGRERVEITLG